MHKLQLGDVIRFLHVVECNHLDMPQYLEQALVSACLGHADSAVPSQMAPLVALAGCGSEALLSTLLRRWKDVKEKCDLRDVTNILRSLRGVLGGPAGAARTAAHPAPANTSVGSAGLRAQHPAYALAAQVCDQLFRLRHQLDPSQLPALVGALADSHYQPRADVVQLVASLIPSHGLNPRGVAELIIGLVQLGWPATLPPSLPSGGAPPPQGPSLIALAEHMQAPRAAYPATQAAHLLVQLLERGLGQPGNGRELLVALLCSKLTAEVAQLSAETAVKLHGAMAQGSKQLILSPQGGALTEALCGRLEHMPYDAACDVLSQLAAAGVRLAPAPMASILARLSHSVGRLPLHAVSQALVALASLEEDCSCQLVCSLVLEAHRAIATRSLAEWADDWADPPACGPIGAVSEVLWSLAVLHDRRDEQTGNASLPLATEPVAVAVTSMVSLLAQAFCAALDRPTVSNPRRIPIPMLCLYAFFQYVHTDLSPLRKILVDQDPATLKLATACHAAVTGRRLSSRPLPAVEQVSAAAEQLLGIRLQSHVQLAGCGFFPCLVSHEARVVVELVTDRSLVQRPGGGAGLRGEVHLKIRQLRALDWEVVVLLQHHWEASCRLGGLVTRQALVAQSQRLRHVLVAQLAGPDAARMLVGGLDPNWLALAVQAEKSWEGAISVVERVFCAWGCLPPFPPTTVPALMEKLAALPILPARVLKPAALPEVPGPSCSTKAEVTHELPEASTQRGQPAAGRDSTSWNRADTAAGGDSKSWIQLAETSTSFGNESDSWSLPVETSAERLFQVLSFSITLLDTELLFHVLTTAECLV